MTPEGKVKSRVKSVLTKRGAWWYCPVSNGMGAPSLDFLCAIKGNMFGIETKAPGRKPTPRQRLTMRSMMDKDIPCFVIDGTEDMNQQETLWPPEEDAAWPITSLEYLNHWLRQFG